MGDEFPLADLFESWSQRVENEAVGVVGRAQVDLEVLDVLGRADEEPPGAGGIVDLPPEIRELERIHA